MRTKATIQLANTIRRWLKHHRAREATPVPPNVERRDGEQPWWAKPVFGVNPIDRQVFLEGPGAPPEQGRPVGGRVRPPVVRNHRGVSTAGAPAGSESDVFLLASSVNRSRPCRRVLFAEQRLWPLRPSFPKS